MEKTLQRIILAVLAASTFTAPAGFLDILCCCCPEDEETGRDEARARPATAAARRNADPRLPVHLSYPHYPQPLAGADYDEWNPHPRYPGTPYPPPT